MEDKSHSKEDRKDGGRSSRQKRPEKATPKKGDNTGTSGIQDGDAPPVHVGLPTNLSSSSTELLVDFNNILTQKLDEYLPISWLSPI
jgi:hypothetical protein